MSTFLYLSLFFNRLKLLAFTTKESLCAVTLAYLLLALGGTGILRGCHHFFLNYADETLLRLRVEGHGALGQLLDAHGVVPLCRQHILAKRRVTFLAPFGSL